MKPMLRNKIIFVALLFIPILGLTWELFHGGLGANPSEKLNHELGEWSYRLLALNLIWGALVALNWWPMKWRRYNILRRHLGVVTFIYVVLHISFYFLGEGDIALAINQMFSKPYLLVGAAAATILAALAITSANSAVRLMKKDWKRLHRLVYVALALATLHFYLIEKRDWRTTLPVLVPLLILYALRVYRARAPSPRPSTRS